MYHTSYSLILQVFLIRQVLLGIWEIKVNTPQSFVEKMGSTAKPSDQNVDFGVRDTDLL